MTSKEILVVDDEEDVRAFLESLLLDNGYSVRLATDGVVAMKLVQEKVPDLILLDLMMPMQTGSGFYRKLQHHKKFSDVPVIVISGLAGRNVSVSKSVPVFDKPVDEAALLSTISGLI
jgi:CheY-like chemotaxis protein